MDEFRKAKKKNTKRPQILRPSKSTKLQGQFCFYSDGDHVPCPTSFWHKINVRLEPPPFLKQTHTLVVPMFFAGGH